MKRETIAEQFANTCRYFTGIQNDICEAGVKYLDVRDSSKSPYAWPCHKDKNVSNRCAKVDYYTQEEAVAHEKDVHAHWEKMTAALVATRADADARGYVKGKGGQGQIDCPVCKTGRLRYSVASVNGHLWGACSTTDCVRWMQ